MPRTVEIYLAKAKLALGAKRVGMGSQIISQLPLGWFCLGGDIIGHEFHLLSQVAPDSSIIFVQANRDCLPDINFFPYPVSDKFRQLVSGWRTLPCSGKALRHGSDLSLGDRNLSRFGAAALIHPAVDGEHCRSEQEKMQQRFAKEPLHRRSPPPSDHIDC